MLKSTVSSPAPQPKTRSRCWKPLVYPRSAVLQNQSVRDSNTGTDTCNKNENHNDDTDSEETTLTINPWFPLHESVLQATLLQLLILEEMVDRSNLRVMDTPALLAKKREHEQVMTKESDEKASLVGDSASETEEEDSDSVITQEVSKKHSKPVSHVKDSSGYQDQKNEPPVLSAESLIQAMMHQSSEGQLNQLLNESANDESEISFPCTRIGTLHIPPRKVSMDGKDMMENSSATEGTTKHPTSTNTTTSSSYLLSKPNGWMDQVVGSLDVCRHIQHDGEALQLVSAPENLPTYLEASIATESQLQQVALWQCQRILLRGNKRLAATTLQSFLRLNDKQPSRPRRRPQHREQQQPLSPDSDPALRRDWQTMANYLLSVSHALFWKEARVMASAATGGNHRQQGNGNILPHQNTNDNHNTSCTKNRNARATPTKLPRNLFALAVAIARCSETGVSWEEWFSEHQEMLEWINLPPTPQSSTNTTNSQPKRVFSSKQITKHKRAKTTIKSLEPEAQGPDQTSVLSAMVATQNNPHKANEEQ